MKVLVTGGFGFIGSHIADKFHREGYDISIIDNMTSGKKENFIHNHRFYELSVEDLKCEEVFKSNNFDIIIHMAAPIDEVCSLASNYQETKSTILGLINILDLSVKYNVKKFIYASSASVYGDDTDFPSVEDSSKNPMTVSAVNKLHGEYYCSKWSTLYHLDTVSIRMSNVYGPRQDPENGGAVAAFIEKLSEGSGIIIYGDGEQLRDFIYVEDVADAVYKAANIKFSGVLNLSTGKATSINHLVKIIEKYGAFKTIQHVERRFGEIRNSSLDNTSIVRIFDWIPITSLEEGIDKTYENYIRSVANTAVKSPKNTGKVRKGRKLPAFIASKAKKKRWLPYLENVSAFVLLTLFSINNAHMYNNLPIDLNLLLIIVFTIVYGTRQGIVSFLLSFISSVLIFILTGRDPMILLYSTDFYLTFAYYVFISFIIGYVKDNLTGDNSDKKEKLDILNEKIGFLTSIYNDMGTVRDELQSQIVNSEDSLGKIISIIQELDTLNPEEVFTKAIIVLEKLMKTQGVAIFRFNETSKYARLMACSPRIYETIPKSIKIDENPEIINAIVSRDLYVSKELAEGKPLLVMPVLDRGNAVGSILIYSSEFERLTLSYQNYFRIITNLISSALFKAYAYDVAIENEKYIPRTHILKPAIFHEMVASKRVLRKNYNLNFIILKIILNGVPQKSAADAVGGIIRDTDFMGLDEESNLFLVLGNTNEREAEFVTSRLAKLGFSAELIEVVEENE